MKQAIKQWIDPITVPREICRIQDEYENQGYEVRRIGTSVIQLMLQDGIVDIWWEHGVFWQEIRENEK